MALLPLCSGTIRLTATASSAVANRNGTGRLYLLFAGNTQSGSRVERITAYNMCPEGSSFNPYQARVYIADALGNNPRLFREQIVGDTSVATSVTTTNISEYVIFKFPGGLVLGTNSSIYVGQNYTGTTQITNWTAEGSDFV